MVNTRYIANGSFRVMKITTNPNGYKYFVPSNNKVRKAYFIHRLLYQLFIGDIPEDMYVHHINDKSDDNRLENLQLVSREENLRFRWHKVAD